MDSQLFPLHHSSLYLPPANYQRFLNKAETGAARDPTVFWMGCIQVTRKSGVCWLNVLEGLGNQIQGAAQLAINPPTETKGVPDNCRPGEFEYWKKVHK